MPPLPANLASTIRAHHRAHPPRREWEPVLGAAGEIVIAESLDGATGGRPRGTFMLVRQNARGVWQALWCHPYTEIATEWDVVVPGEVSGAPYTLAVCAELYAPLLPGQLLGRVGTVDGTLAVMVADSLWSGDEALPVPPAPCWRGLALHGAADARRAALAEQLGELNRVVGATRRALSAE